MCTPFDSINSKHELEKIQGSSLNLGSLFWVPNIVRHPHTKRDPKKGHEFRELRTCCPLGFRVLGF